MRYAKAELAVATTNAKSDILVSVKNAITSFDFHDPEAVISMPT